MGPLPGIVYKGVYLSQIYSVIRYSSILIAILIGSPFLVLGTVTEVWPLSLTLHTINLQTLEIEEIQSNETVEDYWDRIFKITALGEVSRFGKLSKLIQVRF